MTIDELRRAIKDLRPLDPQSPWDQRRLQLREKILTDNPEQFLTWPTVTGAMFVGNAPYIDLEYKALPPRYREVRDPGFGGPVMYNRELSGNYIHQAYHLWQWEQTAKRWGIADLDKIAEFGGGYGAMTVICRQLGFEGDYALMDFPEFRLLQSYYLDQVSYRADYIRSDVGGKWDLLIACHSLSEVDLETREWVINNIDTFSYLFVFHCEDNGVDNLAWFTELMSRKPEYEWRQWGPEHLPNERYQVGVRKK